MELQLYRCPVHPVHDPSIYDHVSSPETKMNVLGGPNMPGTEGLSWPEQLGPAQSKSGLKYGAEYSDTYSKSV